ncbi:uncharacterized protein LOC107368389 [Tetranychus urticae]|uniref:uncharacterized protein LOC107368389 n=1 Tax=Tetranychus urticae TaxID=32264 RepID=UPI00077BC0BF|nr:uncharacterized protein LOC107368389 [Tetranychus urticae]
MNTNDNDCDKTTIRVELSDACRDIIIDWSKEYNDVKKELFRQMAEFTGIPIEKTWDIVLNRPPIGNGVYPDNPFVHSAGSTAYLRFENSDREPEDRPQSYWVCTKKDFRYKFFGNDNCFALNTRMRMRVTLDELYVSYSLVHRDLIDETECNTMFCHHSSNRAFLDKQAKIMNSNIESYLRDQPRPVPDTINGIYILENEMYDIVFTRKREILADLNIGQYFDEYCKLSYSRARPRIYWPNRG